MSKSMNARIRQLAEDAARQSPDGYRVVIDYNDDFVIKFSELLLEECMRTINHIVTDADEDYEWCDDLEAGYDAGLKAAKDAIRSHFLMNDEIVRLNRLLLALYGTEKSVDLWWITPNAAFGQATPLETFQKWPTRVAEFIHQQFHS